MADDVLKPTFSIKVEDNEFIFRVPTPLEKAKLGSREAAIRRSLDGFGSAYGLDEDTFCLVRGMAVLELFLDKTNARWVYTETKPEKGPAKVVVDIEAFPPGTETIITEVGREFQAGLDKFHGRGAGSVGSAVDETVESGVDTGAL